MFCKPTYFPNGLRFGGCLENDGTATLDIYTIVDATGNLTITNQDIIFATTTLTVTYPDPATTKRPITTRNIAGTTTLASVSGTIEVSTLTVGESATLAPRASGWFVI